VNGLVKRNFALFFDALFAGGESENYHCHEYYRKQDERNHWVNAYTSDTFKIIDEFHG
jgi:hypothetical protein